jgi:single-strand DNA-binding protein
MFNKVILIGNLTRDVELKYTQGGSAIAKFGLAVNRTWKDRNTGEKREEVCYIDINIFGRSAEIANQHLAKGKRILVEGRLQFEQWQDQTGQKRSKHSISAESFQFLDSKSDSQQGSGQSAPAQNNNSPFDTNNNQVQNNSSSTNQIEIDDDDIPF